MHSHHMKISTATMTTVSTAMTRAPTAMGMIHNKFKVKSRCDGASVVSLGKE